MRSRPHPTRARAALAAALTTTVLVTGCSAASSDDTGTSSGTTATDTTGTVYDASAVHSFAVELDDGDYEQMLATYQESGEKEWVTGTVTIDGEEFTEVGLRLKGNSSLRSAKTDADPTDLPWLIDLDKYVDGADLDGYSEFVVRSNSSVSALNEAVTLDLLEQAGLASEHAIATRFSVNGEDEVLRLVVQNLDGDWDEENFATDGILYKAEAGGDYSYRGDDPADYEDVFDQETGKDEENLEPLIEFLDFINNSSDADFAAELEDHLDVEAFATYLAFEDLVGNFDDIDGPGNNSYLRYDAESATFTVVAWDHNLALGVGMGGRGGPRGADGERPEGFQPPGGRRLPEGFEPPADGQLPEGFEPPEGMELPEGFEPGEGGARGMGGRSNILVERFKENADFNALYEKAMTDLEQQLFTSGAAQDVLDTWVALLEDDADDLIDAKTLESEADAVAKAIADPGSSAPALPEARRSGTTEQDS